MRAITRSFLLFAALLIGAELLTRFAFVRTMEGRFDYGYHPTVGFVEKPDGKVELQRAGGRRFFPQTFAQQRPEGTYRIMVIGDSVARGKSVKESYAGQLEKQLRAQGIQAECLNLGLPGYGARRKDIVLRQVMKYQPSLVILHVGMSNEYEDERESRRRDDFNSPHPKNWLMRSLVLRQLYEMKTEKIYWQWLPNTVRNQSGVSDANVELLATSDENTQREWLERLQKVTQDGLQRLQAARIPTLLVVQASNTKKEDGQGGILLDDRVTDSWTAPLTSDLVARVTMKSVIPPTQVTALYTDSNHVRPEGHRLIAEAIARTLKDKGWLPAPGIVK
ncbi:hypothetical protein EI77_02416 [Prosthecobacter fusiformis]|uniref:Lysophospholipase L1-like esterase n=1 Tax=Prosthecobacter fusiformis TaxID=48464 RepID=A0A4V3FFL9_9BACT|nr:hypothetical protein [Prosthecobacter fusiformis]TDU71293.1 hypothetical protein EI77_02416 [Prosthecobacter fusiformis]